MAQRTAYVSRTGAVNNFRRLLYNSEASRRLFGFAIFVASLLLIFGGTYVIGMTDYGIFALAGVIAVVMGVVIVLRPDIGLFLLIASVYTNSSHVLEVAFGIPNTNQLLVALMFVSVIGTRSIIQRRPLRFSATEVAIIAYAGVAVITLFAAGEVSAAFDNIVDFAKDIAIILIVVQLCTDELAWKRMQWVLIVCAGILSTLTLYQSLTGNYAFNFWGYANAPVHQVFGTFDNNRPTGPLDDPNFYSQILLLAMPIAFYRMLTDTDSGKRLLAGYFWFAIVLTVIFSYSRAAFLALLVVMFLIVLERRMDMVRVMLGVSLLVIVIFPLLPRGYTERLGTLTTIFGGTETQTELSFRGRTSEAIAAFMMFQDHPLTGVGYGRYQANYLDYSIQIGLDDRLQERQAHSIYLEVISETGIIGIVSFSIMLATVFIVTQHAVTIFRQIGREDLIPWVRGIQFGFLSYSLTSIFLHDDYARYYRLGLALMASAAVMSDTLLAQYQARRENNLGARVEDNDANELALATE